MVRVGLALGLRAIDALVADGSDVGPVKYCLLHHRLLVPVEPDSVHRWRAAHSDCVPAPRSWGCDASGYRGCSGLWVTRPGTPLVEATAAEALHVALSRTRASLRAPLSAPYSRHRQVCRA
ncbi:hypothetical protein ABZZ79_22295 [Streptomyces sp. NPDC006458]|uniref:hypothetical protein n=1 Tax=Streptomyces TaxID=1883 RepID=UPI0029AC4133|nr:hypothetical protein [Streptomyces scabiei]MDX3204758.1 hypothetical protein [Streptomyces scabiei]